MSTWRQGSPATVCSRGTITQLSKLCSTRCSLAHGRGYGTGSSESAAFCIRGAIAQLSKLCSI